MSMVSNRVEQLRAFSNPHPVAGLARQGRAQVGSSVFQEHLRYALNWRRAARRETCTGPLRDLYNFIATWLSVKLRERFSLADRVFVEVKNHCVNKYLELY